MSIGASWSGYVRVTTGDQDLPVEVRDPRMRLVDQGLSGWSPADELHGRDLRLDPGIYIVSVRLPGGRTLAEAVNLQAGERQLVDLRPEREWLLPRVRYATVSSVAEQPGAEQTIKPNYLWAIRLFQFEGLSETSLIPLVDIRLAAQSVPGLSTMEIATLGRGVFFAQLARADGIPLNVALFPGSENSCLLTVEVQADDLYASALPGGKEVVKRAAQFLAAGENQHAGLLITSEEAESLLQDKVADPIAAAIGGYALLRSDELKRTHNWTENLASWFPWLPDGAVIAGEKAAMLGNHQQALDYFLQARDRGLPLFTDGFSILVSRMRQYKASPHILAELTGQQANDIQFLSAKLETWSPFVDFSALTLSFRAAEPTNPAKSQYPVGFFSEYPDGYFTIGLSL